VDESVSVEYTIVPVDVMNIEAGESLEESTG
jgi:hypothetical protein